MIKPISPEEIQDKKNAAIPEEVLEVFNELIQKDWDGDQAVVYQHEAADLVGSKLGLTRQGVYDENLLDIEDIYRKAGWKVRYDKPSYTESGSPSWCFSKE